MEDREDDMDGPYTETEQRHQFCNQLIVLDLSVISLLIDVWMLLGVVTISYHNRFILF